MRAVVSWLSFAVGVMAYVLAGQLLGWDTGALRADLFPLLFGAAAGIAIHTRERQ